MVVSFGVILSLGFSKKSYAKIDHNFSFSDGGNQHGGGSQQYITVVSNNSILDMGKGIDLQYLDGFVGKNEYINKGYKKTDDCKLHYWKTDLPSDGVYHLYETSFELSIDTNDFYLCYDASGELDDDWSNQMMYLKIIFLK